MKIMLVDDKSTSNFIMKRLLTRQDHALEVFDFTDSEMAFFSLPEIKPDLIFLDLQMPFMDGWDFLDKMQQEKHKYPVIILSSSTRPDDLKKSEDYGNVLSYEVKPMKENRLREIL